MTGRARLRAGPLCVRSRNPGRVPEVEAGDPTNARRQRKVPFGAKKGRKRIPAGRSEAVPVPGSKGMNTQNGQTPEQAGEAVELRAPAIAARVRESLTQVAAAPDAVSLDGLRLAALGRKGWLTAALRGLGALPAEERRTVGQDLNAAREALEAAFADRSEGLRREALRVRLASEAIDVTLPARPVTAGRLHPLTRARREIEEIFLRMGYSVAEGPEVEEERLNFELLNIPADHPARDMQDSFYPADLPGFVLRTHTSPVQVRAMLAAAAATPLRVIVPGRAYRRDEEDATHLSAFHQVEGLAVDRGLSLADLKGELALFARAFFGPGTQVRLRPSYFPFTEPSAELDVTCPVCSGAGCRVCKTSGFIELLGAGMVHPRVLRNGGYDPECVQGFAFGMGLERAAMLRSGLEDVRLLSQGDLAFLRQGPFLTGWPPAGRWRDPGSKGPSPEQPGPGPGTGRAPAPQPASARSGADGPETGRELR